MTSDPAFQKMLENINISVWKAKDLEPPDDSRMDELS